jgi:hypothetical protein
MATVLCETHAVSVSFPFPVTVTAHRSFEVQIQFFRDRMISFETSRIRFTAIETTNGVSDFLAACFESPRTRDGIGIIHTLVSGAT